MQLSFKGVVVNMQPIINHTHKEIQHSLLRAIQWVTENILVPLKISANIPRKDLLEMVIRDIGELGFNLVYTDSLYDDITGMHVPAMIILNNGQRKGGGTIKINRSLPMDTQIEAIYHEYIHLKDPTLPVHGTNKDAINFEIINSRKFMEDTEFQADMYTYTLMMPPEQMKFDILRYGYNINSIIELYKGYKKSTLLHWITMVCSTRCHFSLVQFEKDYAGNTTNIFVSDSCYYDNLNDPVYFDIATVMNNPSSAAAQAIMTKSDTNKASVINGREFYCYAYYESDLSKQISKKYHPGTTAIVYDQLLVIGWSMENYYMTQRLREGYLRF